MYGSFKSTIRMGIPLVNQNLIMILKYIAFDDINILVGNILK